MVSAPALTAEELGFAYVPGGPQAVCDIGFVAARGEVLVLLGPNGSGKSTVLDLCAGLLEPATGRVLLGDAPLIRLSPRERARRVARVPQDLPRWPGTDVRTFVAAGRYAWRPRFAPPRPADLDAVEAALEATGIAAHARRRIDRLSGGERQRALVARALAQDTPILLCDEPTSSLDVRAQIEVLELCATASAERAVVLVTHDLNLAAQFADRVVLLRAGTVFASGGVEEVLAPDVVGAVYGDDLHYARLPADGRPGAGRPLVVPRRPMETEDPAR